MKKTFTILTAAMMLLVFMTPTMAGWGQSRLIKTYKLTIDANDFNSTSYAANNNEKTSNAVNTSDNTDTYEVKWTSYQVMKGTGNDSGKMQWRSNQGKIYNSTDLGTITSVTVNSTAGTFTTYYGTKSDPGYSSNGTTPGSGKGFFRTFVGGATGKSSKVEVVFEIESAGLTQLDSPTNFTATPGNGEATFTWDAVENASSYTISYTTDGETWTDIDGIDETSFTKTGLKNDTEYTCKIKAVGDGEDYSDSEYSETITVTPTGATFYTITIDNGIENGSVEASASSATEGTSITLTSAADAGYDFDAWNVYKTGDQTTTVTVNNNAFNMPDYNVTVSATFTPKTKYTIIKVATNGTITTDATNDEAYEGQVVSLTLTPNSGYEFSSLTVVDADEDEVAVTNNHFTMPGKAVTVTATFTLAAEWVETSLAELTTDDIFVIVGNNGSNYAMTNDKGTSNPPVASAVTITNGKLTSTVADNIKWNISGNSTDGYTFYPNGSTTTWLYCTNTNNGVRVGTNDNKTFKLNNGYLKHDGTSRYVGIYSSQDWRCYTSSDGNIANQTFGFYKYQIPSSVATPTFSVEEGTYYENQSVTITCATPDATIYYTTDGSEPTTSSSTYSNALSINQTTTLKAKAYKNSEWSNMASATYTLKVATPTFSIVTGTYTSVQSVTITSTAGASIYYTLDGTTPTGSSTPYSGAISINETKTLKAIAIKSNWENSEVASATYTINLPLTTMDAIFAASATSGSYYVSFNDWVVSGVRPGNPTSNRAYVTDGEKGFLISKSGHNFAVGDKLNGTVQCSLSRSAGAAQITNITSSTEGLTVTSGGTVTVADIPMASLSGVNTGALVSYTNLTYDGTNLSDGTTVIKPYSDLTSLSGLFTNGKTYNVTGVYLQYNDTKEILPRTSDDVELKANINATDFSGLTLFTYVEEEGPSAPQSVTISGSDFSGNLTVTASDKYQVSSDNSTWGTTATYAPTSGTVSGTLYIRLADGLSAGTYNGNLTFTADNFNTKEVALEGTVSETVLYTVSIASGIENGTIESDKTTAEANETVTITVTPADCYELATLTYNDGTTTTNIDQTTKQFTMPANNVTVNATFTQKTYTIKFSVNGSIEDDLTYNLDCGDAITLWNADDMLIVDVEIPAGFALYGWSTSAVDLTQTAPTIVLPTYVPTEDMTLYAVFATAEENGYKYTLVGTDNIEQGTYLIGALLNGTASNSFYFATTSISSGDLGTNSNATVINDVGGVRETTSLPNGAVEFTFTGNNTDGFTITADNTNYLGCTEWSSNRKLAFDGDYSSIAWKVCAHNSPLNTNGIYFKRYTGIYYYTISENGYSQESAIRGYSSTKDNDKIYRALYLFKKGVNSTYSNYCTSVSGETAISGTIEEGHLTTDGTIPSGTAVYINTPLIINSGVTLTVNGVLGNDSPANLIIEDGGQLICNNSVQATVKKNIAGHETGSRGNATSGWNFIATPAADGTTPTTENGLLDATPANYDLYYYDEPHHYWRNYKVGEGNVDPGFNNDGGKLLNGKGYLYANANNTELSFEGATVAANKEIDLTLSYSDAIFPGFNLVGNPFTYQLTYSSEITLNGTTFSTYYMIENGEEISATTITDTPINPGTGFMVQANGENQHLVFNPSGDSRGEKASKPSYICIEAGDADFMDRAYVQFGQGNTLRKMTINDNVSHVYVMSDGKDYAAATIQEARGEMPVNFKAHRNGQYTITVNPQEVEMDYLHLIDNIAGVDVNLLANPSYSFNAKADDYESRFRLVFSANSENESGNENDNFAFISDGQLIVTGEGTMQVIDMMGRVISSEMVNGTTSKTIDAKAGVYVLRLINGTDVKTQKIVVK